MFAIKNMNELINRINILYEKTAMYFVTLFIYFECNFKNVLIGSRNSFYGNLKIFKSKNSVIRIGNFNVFRSSRFSNLVGINRPCIISTLSEHAQLEIKNNCGLSGVVINCFKEIEIQDNVMIGANTLIMDGDWHHEDIRSGESKKILIEKNAWIGVNVTILKGVIIGENSVIGAGSVVTKSIPANVFAAGNPCAVIKSMTNE